MESFLALVREMRRCQRRYDKHPTAGNCRIVLDAERRVDFELDQLAEVKQAKLFAADDRCSVDTNGNGR